LWLRPNPNLTRGKRSPTLSSRSSKKKKLTSKKRKRSRSESKGLSCLRRRRRGSEKSRRDFWLNMRNSRKRRRLWRIEKIRS